MQHHRRWFACVLGVALAVAWGPASAAVYRESSVDGRRYRGTLHHADYGRYENAEIRFRGEHVYVHFVQGGRLVLVLEDEDIQDPHEIMAYDPRRGITWELDVKDMAGDH